jgi:hypothetical protein
MANPTKVLLQTTISFTQDDDWHIGRFSRLRAYLAGLRDDRAFPSSRSLREIAIL